MKQLPFTPSHHRDQPETPQGAHVGSGPAAQTTARKPTTPPCPFNVSVSNGILTHKAGLGPVPDISLHAFNLLTVE